jgi:hypothetical protein
MSGEVLFYLAIPAAVAVFIVWMIAGGYSKTGTMPVDKTPSPYPERFDRIGRWGVATATVVLYLVIANSLGLRVAAIAFAVFLLVDVVGALIWTAAQQLRRSSDVAFTTRLFRNFRDFYAVLVVGILAYG